MTVASILLYAMLGIAMATAAGAVSGITLAGSQLGLGLAAAMGGFFGFLGGSGAVATGLAITLLL